MTSRAANMGISYQDELMEIKRRFNLAFAAMRAAGLLARQSFKCCGSCAGAALATEVGKWNAAKKAKVGGAVFYTVQGAEAFTDRFAARRLGRGEFAVWLTYGQIEPNGQDPVGKPTVEVGGLVMKALTEAGLDAVWDGKPETSIRVTGLAAAVAAVARLAGVEAAKETTFAG